MSDTAGGNWRERFPVKRLEFKGYNWIDREEAPGVLAHAFEAFPRDMIPVRIRSLCGRPVAGPMTANVESKRACAECVDLISAREIRREDERLRDRMKKGRR